MTIIHVMTTIPLADAKARLSAVLDEVRDTHERVVITRNGRPEAVILAVTRNCGNHPPAATRSSTLAAITAPTVNGQRVASKLLIEADLVSIGHSTFHLEGGELVQFVDDEQVTSTAQDLAVPGKLLSRELAGYHFARRGAYRVVYRIDDAAWVVHVVRIDHRSSPRQPPRAEIHPGAAR